MAVAVSGWLLGLWVTLQGRSGLTRARLAGLRPDKLANARLARLRVSLLLSERLLG